MEARFHPLLGFLVFLAVYPVLGIKAVYSQSITSATDASTTISSPVAQPNQFDIDGGIRSGGNLFHSFQQFGLSQGQVANFLSKPDIQNILGRVVGGNATMIDGLVQVTGGQSNLFLMNPAGIIFGANARLNVPASFTATTANAIGIGAFWFNATGSNRYGLLDGTPNQFAFTSTHPGAIFNAGQLAVNAGQSITLLGGTVIHTGTLSAPGGTVTIASVPGENLVRITPEGSLLSLVLPTETRSQINPSRITPLSLPALLTGGTIPEVTGVVVENGSVKLTASNTTIPPVPGNTIVSGQLSTTTQVSSLNPTIHVLGDHVSLVNANLSASSPNRGGTVFIGSESQSQGTSPLQPHAIVVDALTQIEANALTEGNGGQVVIWTDGTAQVQGLMTATGGVQGGNGGWVETSGHQQLDVTGGRVDASAPQGIPGTWVIDPVDITIATVGGTVTPTQIAASLDSGTNVWLTTALGTGGNGDIILANSINQMGGGNAALTLAGRRFANPGNTTISMTSKGGLTFNLNQVNPEVNAPSSSIQSAINAIGAVAGTRTINLGAGTYSGNTITIDRALTLTGAGADNTILSGNNTYQVIRITGRNPVNLDSLAIVNGMGGGIDNEGGTLNLTNSSVTNNSGRGIYNGGSRTGGDCFRSPCYYYAGTVNVTNSLLSGNSGGGITNIGGSVNVTNSTLSGNSAGGGGGIFTTGYIEGDPWMWGTASSGRVTVMNSTLVGNSATNGGGIYNIYISGFTIGGSQVTDTVGECATETTGARESDLS